ASGSLSPEIKSFRRSRNSLEFGWGEVLQQHFRNVFFSNGSYTMNSLRTHTDNECVHSAYAIIELTCEIVQTTINALAEVLYVPHALPFSVAHCQIRQDVLALSFTRGMKVYHFSPVDMIDGRYGSWTPKLGRSGGRQHSG
ncbi:hypothetical protein JG687_00009277, partial [Phytophthora cactorum]